MRSGKESLVCLVFLVLISSLPRIPSVNAEVSSSSLSIGRVIFEGGGIPVETIAEKADLYMSHFEQGWRVAEIKSLNPKVICLLYRDIRAVSEESDEYRKFLDSGWILKDANGMRIHSKFSLSKWIVDPGNLAYQQWVANWLKTYMDRYGYDGAFLDNCLPSTEYMYSTEPGPAINPRTGNAFTSEEFKQAMISLVDRIKAAVGSRLVVGNGIYHGERFFQSGRHQNYVDLLLNSAIDGIESEGWIMDRDAAEWYSEDKWLKSIEFAVWLENNFLNKGQVFLPVTQNAEPYNNQGESLPSGCTKNQYVAYSFASLLLAASSNHHYINFGYYLNSYVDTLFNLDLGTPLGSYYMVQGTHVYARDFTKVKVFVNPTTQTYTVPLDAQYQNLDGTPATSPLTVKPHTGVILKRTGEIPPQTTFESGFETGSFSEWDGTFVTGGESAAVVTTLPYQGTYHARFRTDGGASTARAYCIKSLAGMSEIHVRMYVYVRDGLPLSAGHALWLIQLEGSDGSLLASYGIKADQTGTKWACMRGSSNAYAASGPGEGRWYLVEAVFKKASSGKTVILYVDGTEVASLSPATSSASSVAKAQVGIAYNNPGYAFDIYVDNVTIDIK